MTPFHKTLRIRRKTTLQTMCSKAEVFFIGKHKVSLRFSYNQKFKKLNMSQLEQFRGWAIFEHFHLLLLLLRVIAIAYCYCLLPIAIAYCLLLLLRVIAIATV